MPRALMQRVDQALAGLDIASDHGWAGLRILGEARVEEALGEGDLDVG